MPGIDLPILVSAWVAFVLWVTGEVVLAGRGGGGPSMRWRRRVWALGAAALLLHVAMAFGRAHGWSHSVAVEATARQLQERMGISWGGGVFINYLLLAWWSWDAVAAWLCPNRWNMPGPVRSLRRAVFWFLWFNGAVVFAAGSRQAIAAVLCLGVLVRWRMSGHSRPSDRIPESHST